MERIKYITNKEFLTEIHRSKSSYCFFERPEYATYDAIVGSIEEITPEIVEFARNRRATLLSTKTAIVTPESIETDSLIFRVRTGEHIPLDPTGKRRPRVAGEPSLVRTNFPPFKHYMMRDGEYAEVGRSHWQGSLSNGEFCIDHGAISRRLGIMFMLLADRYSRRGNWRSYTYVDEMRSMALLQLSQIGLQFDESKSENPFAFYTTIITNCFRRVLYIEKRNQNIRDDLLIMAGAAPSFTRQIEHEMNIRQESATPPADPPKKTRGRKPKVATHEEWLAAGDGTGHGENS